MLRFVRIEFDAMANDEWSNRDVSGRAERLPAEQYRWVANALPDVPDGIVRKLPYEIAEPASPRSQF
jgi:hypothetical protein